MYSVYIIQIYTYKFIIYFNGSIFLKIKNQLVLGLVSKFEFPCDKATHLPIIQFSHQKVPFGEEIHILSPCFVAKSLFVVVYMHAVYHSVLWKLREKQKNKLINVV